MRVRVRVRGSEDGVGTGGLERGEVALPRAVRGVGLEVLARRELLRVDEDGLGLALTLTLT